MPHASRPYRAEPPKYGPALIRARDGLIRVRDRKEHKLYVSLGADPQLGVPEMILMVPVQRAQRQGAWEIDPTLSLRSSSLEQSGQTDWFTEPVLTWSGRQPRYIAVLLLYPQGDRMGRSAYGFMEQLQAMKGGIVDADKHIEGGGAVSASSISDGLPDPELQRFARRALRRMRSTDAMLPPGILELAPTPRDGLRLALGSCQYPPGIVNQFCGWESWRVLGESLGGQRPDLVVLTGDQVYADATAGLFDPGLLDDRFRKPHEAWLGNAHVRRVLSRVPMVTTIDDHEIDDNWEPVSERCPPEVVARNEALRRDGVDAFQRYQRPPDAEGKQPPPTAPLWFQFAQNGIPVFVLDSRSERRLRTAATPDAWMFKSDQWNTFCEWLLEHRDEPKIVVSASVLLPRHRRAAPAVLASKDKPGHGQAAPLRSDGWDGFPETLHALLALIASQNIRQLVFLSGDEHLGLYAKATVRGKDGPEVVLHSVHSPGLNIPYRFANAYPAEILLGDDAFDFSYGGGQYSCNVATQAFERAGFVGVAVTQNAERAWQLELEFPGAPLPPILL